MWLLCYAVFTLVATIEDARESIGALEVEKRGNGEDQEQADQQRSQKKRGCHPGLLLSGREKQEVVDCKTCRGSYLLLQTLEKQNLHDTDFTGFFSNILNSQTHYSKTMT